ncbi:hypothetical protein MNB_SUP05-SYMBIONT-4-1175 [hydrothermal vent metagenome]|uniref:DUF302 domain-containing protein n=1 Tax=hydrothermal vent metagenome TaxID=652676 RepID=A0A1W1E4Q1_9ZZZZ|nr:DUF302 domain-containing protein [Gammaproteobacteria bacterium]
MLKYTVISISFILLISKTVNASIYIERIAEDSFFNVKEDITMAIAGQGLIIAHHSDVATMLNRTTKDLARQTFNMMANIMPITPFRKQKVKTTYRHGVVIEFCSASLSAETTAADPNNILFCPFSIAIFQLNNEPNQVHVSYLRLSQFADADNPQSVVALTKVENMLAEIVVEALD